MIVQDGHTHTRTQMHTYTHTHMERHTHHTWRDTHTHWLVLFFPQTCHQRVIELQLRLAIEKEISSRTLEMCDTRVNSSTGHLMEEYDVCGVVISEGEQLKAVSYRVSDNNL